MIKLAYIIACKDFRLVLGNFSALARAVLLGLLLIFVFSLSSANGGSISGKEAAAVFWLASTFCQILIFNQLYALEEENGARVGLALSSYPAQGIWIGKAFCGLVILALAQLVFLPASVVFLGQYLKGSLLLALGAILGADFGICALGSLMGAVAFGGRESLLSIVLFPLLIPILLGGISLCGQCFDGAPISGGSAWPSIILAFDAVFAGAGLALFGFIYNGDD